MTRIRPAYPDAFGDPTLAAQLGLDRTYLVEVPRGSDTPRMAQRFRGLGLDVQAASVDVIGGVAGFIPNDPMFSQQYGLHNTGQPICTSRTNCTPGSTNCFPGLGDADIDAPEAWEIHTGLTGDVVLAVVDSGVYPHVEFGSRLLPGVNTNEPRVCVGGANPGAVCASDVDCPDGVCTFTSNTSDPVGHGTHVAGIAAAAGNNGQGGAGVSWGATILPVRVVDSQGRGTALQAANGLIWAADHGADIVNMSLQYAAHPVNNPPADLAFFEAAVNYAHAQGILVVVAAGNFKTCENSLIFCAADTFCQPGEQCIQQVVYPARFDNALAVSATTNTDELASFSNFGSQIDLSAPGEYIWSTDTAGCYRQLSGTSMSAPFVSGTAALLKSYNADLSHLDLRALMEATADDLGDPGWDPFFGFGRINVHQALLATPPPIAIIDSFPPDSAIDARQPHDLNGLNPVGWDTIELTFDGDAGLLTAASFAVTVEPAGTAPSIASVFVEGGTATLFLDSIIPLRSWTRVTHLASQTSVRLGYLPADVNGSGTSDSKDILSLVNALNGLGTPLPIWSLDIDRSGQAWARDILRVVDLLNGAAAFEVYNLASLP